MKLINKKSIISIIFGLLLIIFGGILGIIAGAYFLFLAYQFGVEHK